MSIYDNKKTHLKAASIINGYDKISSIDLANEYIENENNYLADNYFSALIINHWSLIYKLKYSVSFCRNILFEDIYEWLVESILIVLKYRKWLDKSSSLYQDPDAFEKMLNMTISHIRIANLDKIFRKDRFKDNFEYSLDKMKEDFDFDFPYPYQELDDSNIYYIVQYYINCDRILNGLIIDLLCYSDTQIYDRKLKRLKFSMVKLNLNLSLLNNKYIETFVNKYNNVSEQHLINIRKWFNETDPYKVARKIRNIFKTIRNDLSKNEELNKILIV